MKIQKLLIVIFFFISALAAAQNPRLSQIGSMASLLNPSLSGRFDGKIRIGGLYSYQKTQVTTVPHQDYSIDLKFGKYRSSGDEEVVSPNADSSGKNRKPAREGKDETGAKPGNKGYWGVTLNYYHYGDDKSPLKGTFYSGTLARHFYVKRNKYFGIGAQVTYAEGDLDERRGIEYDKEISAGTFRYPQGIPNNRVSKTNYVDYNVGGYYGMVTDAVGFELGLAMYHLFYPKIDIFNKDSESKLRHRVTAHSVLRLKLNDKWGLLQKNIYWQEGLYYRSKSFNDSLNIVAFWTGIEFYRTNPQTNYNVNFGLYTRSFRTVMPYLNLNAGHVVNVRYTYEFPLNSSKYSAYTAKRHEVALFLTYKRNTTPGTRFYKKTNFW